ncbi:MaoC family dehydratase [Oxalobacteraceae bacterium CAVE-383]|nr:MaoC family dehydratase [Oxalobacteraceae bacterium CAVE-383]
MIEIGSLAQLKQMVGSEVAVSDWLTVEQQQVDRFAEATGDRQWIHVDVERSRRELPYGGTVAHGFLTLALLPRFFGETIRMSDVRMMVNYGLNRVRFPAPLPVGDRVRGHLKLLDVTDIPGGAEMIWEVSVEREGEAKPVCVAEAIFRRY